MRYDLPCAHTNDEHEGVIVDDFHPLSREEIASLCSIAQSTDDITVASIQLRLFQAMLGMTCPPPLKGNMRERLDRLGAYYVNNIHHYGCDRLFVERIYALCNEETALIELEKGTTYGVDR